mmetsp:Transcript_8199/g.26414  ORF Transcript_8199/g.26414 Transcript_8199/m.26414 type:complete len:374 (+) Transcript_8199:954-2075(+)
MRGVGACGWHTCGRGQGGGTSRAHRSRGCVRGSFRCGRGGRRDGAGRGARKGDGCSDGRGGCGSGGRCRGRQGGRNRPARSRPRGGCGWCGGRAGGGAAARLVGPPNGARRCHHRRRREWRRRRGRPWRRHTGLALRGWSALRRSARGAGTALRAPRSRHAEVARRGASLERGAVRAGADARRRAEAATGARRARRRRQASAVGLLARSQRAAAAGAAGDSALPRACRRGHVPRAARLVRGHVRRRRRRRILQARPAARDGRHRRVAGRSDGGECAPACSRGVRGSERICPRRVAFGASRRFAPLHRVRRLGRSRRREIAPPQQRPRPPRERAACSPRRSDVPLPAPLALPFARPAGGTRRHGFAGAGCQGSG